MFLFCILFANDALARACPSYNYSRHTGSDFPSWILVASVICVIYIFASGAARRIWLEEWKP